MSGLDAPHGSGKRTRWGLPFAVLLAMVSQAGVTTPPADPPGFAMDYSIADGKLTGCTVAGTLGDADVDEAVCLLMERCVAEGHDTREAAAVCIRPRLAQMIELVNAGLLEELDGGADNRTSGDVSPQKDDIIVEGSRPPRDGLWLISETGYRIHHADLKVPIEQLRPRTWRRCIKGGELEPILVDMMRVDPAETVGSSCPWTIKAGSGTMKGEQLCTSEGIVERGKLDGRYSESDFRLTKEVRSRQLFVGDLERQRREQLLKSGVGNFGMEDQFPYRRTGVRGTSQSKYEEVIRANRSNDQEFLQVVGRRVNSC